VPSGVLWRRPPDRQDTATDPGKPQHLAASKLLSDNDLLVAINAVNLEYVLGEIQTNRGNLHVDGSLV
jgi:hypothetical protein